MRIMFVMVVLAAAYLAASVQMVVLCSGSEKYQNVGGDFGKAWLSNYDPRNSVPAAQESNNTSAAWGGTPKGKAEVSSDLVNKQNATKPATDWLGDSTILGNQTNTSRKVTQPQPFSISKTLGPIHQMDASFNQTRGTPQPDASGLINGWSADSYYAIGPALDYF